MTSTQKGGRITTKKRRKPICPNRTSQTRRPHGTAGDTGAPVSRVESSNRRALLTPNDREWVKRKAAELGPLTPEEREFLALIFRGNRRRAEAP
jgi:hypothetical protein